MGTLSKAEDTTDIKLSIQISLNGLSFCALSPETRRILFFRDIPFSRRLNPSEVLQQIEKVYHQETFLQEAQPEVKLLYSTELYSLVPQDFFAEDQALDYLKFNTRILENDFAAHDKLESRGIINVHIPFANINNYFFDKYGEFEYRHCVSLLIENLSHDTESHQEPIVYLHCYTGGYDLLVFRKNQLELANSFRCNTKEDFIYYLLFTAEQLKLDPDRFELVLLGKIRENSDFYNMAYTYIRNIRFLETSFGYIFSQEGDLPKGYMYYTLFKSLE